MKLIDLDSTEIFERKTSLLESPNESFLNRIKLPFYKLSSIKNIVQSDNKAWLEQKKGSLWKVKVENRMIIDCFILRFLPRLKIVFERPGKL